MIYLNNAATSYPKPSCVPEAVCQALFAPPREGRRGTLDAGSAEADCRVLLARVLGVKDPERIFFTSGATESFNLILRGLDPAGKTSVVTAYEHNALLRPLWALAGGERVRVACPDRKGIIAPETISELAKDAAFVFVNHCSNVTGAVQGLPALSAAAHASGALLIADVSQSAGLMPLDLDESGADIAVFTGHKALFGPAGTGGFFLRKGVSLPAAKWGGTGTGGKAVLSGEPEQFEVGTQNLSGLAGLAMGASFVLEIGLAEIARTVREKTASLRGALGGMAGVRVYGAPSGGAAVAFNIRGLSPADVGYILLHEYDIVVRTGYHCAPLAADAIGAPEGTVRASLSCLTMQEDLERFLQAVSEIAAGAAEAARCT
ncbi:MAG: aminotransferase class V-fold PLP-dependent enzyme [Clostridiales bacterium]|nr:aminotransferase class V-fold PLP-dependent enzyme [Clostridiales bacterium]